MLADKRVKSGFTDETDRRRDACRWSSVSCERVDDFINFIRAQIQWRDPWRAARNVNRGRASRSAQRGIAGRRLVTPDVAYIIDRFVVSYDQISIIKEIFRSCYEI